MSYEKLYTVLFYAKSINNCRLLTYSIEDSLEFNPLIAAMFLHEIQEVGVADVDATEANDLRIHMKYKLKLKDDLRCRMSVSIENVFQRKGSADIREGDIVLIGLDNMKRLDWP